MGAKEMNFHFDVFARMGYEEAATKIQDAYLDGRKDDAAAAVPTAMVEDIALVGPGGEDPRRPRGVAGVAGHHACSSTATSPRCARWPSSCSAERGLGPRTGPGGLAGGLNKQTAPNFDS